MSGKHNRHMLHWMGSRVSDPLDCCWSSAIRERIRICRKCESKRL